MGLGNRKDLIGREILLSYLLKCNYNYFMEVMMDFFLVPDVKH